MGRPSTFLLFRCTTLREVRLRSKLFDGKGMKVGRTLRASPEKNASGQFPRHKLTRVGSSPFAEVEPEHQVGLLFRFRNKDQKRSVGIRKGRILRRLVRPFDIQTQSGE